MSNDNLCSVCGGTLGASLLEIKIPDRFELSAGVESAGYSRKWSECNVCGTANNVLPAVSVARLDSLRTSYYEVDFANSNIAEKYQKVMSLPPEQSDNAGRVTRIHDFVAKWLPDNKTHTVLDIGAGTGVFLSRFLSVKSARVWQGVGIEPDPIAAEHLRSIDRFQVVEAMFTGQPELQGFSLVTLNKVLEHIEKPLPVLRQVSKALSLDNSILYVEVPDKLTIDRRHPNDNILGALHHHLYDPSSLAYLFKAAGFEPLRIERVIEPSGKITVYGFATLPQCLNKI